MLNWASWSVDTGWTIESDVTVTGADLLHSVELAGYGNDGLMTAFSDQSGSLWGLTYEGGTWSILNGGSALETTVSDLKTKPFSLSVEKYGGDDAPTITAIADQTPLENTATGAIAFTVGATNTPILSALTSAMQGNVLDAQGSLSLLSPRRGEHSGQSTKDR